MPARPRTSDATSRGAAVSSTAAASMHCPRWPSTFCSCAACAAKLRDGCTSATTARARQMFQRTASSGIELDPVETAVFEVEQQAREREAIALDARQPDAVAMVLGCADLLERCLAALDGGVGRRPRLPARRPRARGARLLADADRRAARAERHQRRQRGAASVEPADLQLSTARHRRAGRRVGHGAVRPHRGQRVGWRHGHRWPLPLPHFRRRPVADQRGREGQRTKWHRCRSRRILHRARVPSR